MTKDASLFKGTQIVWTVLYIVEALLLFRFVLKLLGANSAAGFTQFIYSLSSILVAPFRFVFGADVAGASVVEWGTLLAMLVYYIAAIAIVKLFVAGREVEETEARRGLQSQETL